MNCLKFKTQLLTLFVIKHHIGEVGNILPRFLNVCTRWRWLVKLILRPICPQGKILGTYNVGVWMDPRVVMDVPLPPIGSQSFPFTTLTELFQKHNHSEVFCSLIITLFLYNLSLQKRLILTSLREDSFLRK